jgi:Putative neutral zinc metallopeptidase
LAFVVGLLLQLETLTWVGVILFGSSFLLAIVTLPVEFNASARAKELLLRYGIIQGDEQIAGVEKVLGAAAWITWPRRYQPLGSGSSTFSFYFSAEAPRRIIDESIAADRSGFHD